jgi:hypothetical protein
MAPFPYHGRGTKIAEQNMPAYMLLFLSVLWNATVRVSGRLQRCVEEPFLDVVPVLQGDVVHTTMMPTSIIYHDIGMPLKIKTVPLAGLATRAMPTVNYGFWSSTTSATSEACFGSTLMTSALPLHRRHQ